MTDQLHSSAESDSNSYFSVVSDEEEKIESSSHSSIESDNDEANVSEEFVPEAMEESDEQSDSDDSSSIIHPLDEKYPKTSPFYGLLVSEHAKVNSSY